MASPVSSALVAAGTVTGPAAFVVHIAAGLIDAYVLAPRLRGAGRQAGRTPRLFDVPSGSNQPGAPTIWAIGPRIRVPANVLWQSQKVREGAATNSKAGTSVPYRRVNFDAAVALNDRQTHRLLQLIGNGKLLLGESRNIVDLRSSTMTVSAGSDLVLSAGSTADPDFADKFRAGDVVQLAGFVVTSGDLSGYWKVVEAKPHAGSTPSTLRMDPYSGQTVAGIVATAGTPFTPARVTRIDDALFVEGAATVGSGQFYPVVYYFEVTASSGALRTFRPGDQVALSGFNALNDANWLVVETVEAFDAIRLRRSVSGSPVPVSALGGSSNPGIIRHVGSSFVDRLLFPIGFDPALYWHPGSDDQGEDALLAAAFGTGQVPAYRGTAYQGLDSLFVERFGDQLPFSLEGVLEVDQSMTWGEAFVELLKRHAIPASAIDVSGIDHRPFLGFYSRGAVPAITAMQPLLVAGQIVGQERDGTIALFDIANADVVAVTNDATRSDLGCRPAGSDPADEKLITRDPTVEDLPTQVGVTFQNADNGLAEGFETFGLRHPAGVEHTNEQEIDVANVVLTEKQAADLAATVLRRAWINARPYETVLPCAYEDVLENDLITVTDDDGEQVTFRVLQRDIGTDGLVHVKGIAEDVELAVTGSHVDGSAGVAPPSVPRPAELVVELLDCPAVQDSETGVPAMKVAVCAATGSQWAGAALYTSLDGVNWTQQRLVAQQAAIATVLTDLAAAPPAEAFGTTSLTVDGSPLGVNFTYEGAAGLEDATESEVRGGKNWCALIQGDEVEILAFGTAVPSGGGDYGLTDLYRGLRGTRPIAVVAGQARLVMLSPIGAAGIEHVEFPGPLAPTVLVKVVPAGKALFQVDAIAVSARWRNVLPLPVRAVAKAIGSSPFPVRFTVTAHWCRQVLPLGEQPPHPMDEPVEGYRFTLWDATGTQIRYVKDIVADPTTGSPHLRDKWVTFSPAEQTAAGYTPSGSTTFNIDVQQIGQFGHGPSVRQTL